MTPWSATLQPVREMLAEHGVDVPQPGDEQDEYQVLLRALLLETCPSTTSRNRFTFRFPRGTTKGRWTGHSVTMLDRRDNETTPQARAAVEQEMRDTVRRHVPAR